MTYINCFAISAFQAIYIKLTKQYKLRNLCYRSLLQETILVALKSNARAQQITTVKQTAIPYKWTYASAFLYSLTLITTIGEYFKCFTIK